MGAKEWSMSVMYVGVLNNFINRSNIFFPALSHITMKPFVNNNVKAVKGKVIQSLAPAERKKIKHESLRVVFNQQQLKDNQRLMDLDFTENHFETIITIFQMFNIHPIQITRFPITKFIDGKLNFFWGYA